MGEEQGRPADSRRGERAVQPAKPADEQTLAEPTDYKSRDVGGYATDRMRPTVFKAVGAVEAAKTDSRNDLCLTTNGVPMRPRW